MDCVQAVLGKNELLVQFEVWKKKEMNIFLLAYVFSKEEVCLEMDDPISGFTQKEQGELLTIDGDNVVEETCVFERGVYFYVFYFLFCVKEISIYMLEEHVLE